MLHLLGNMCECRGEPIPSIQELMRINILERAQAKGTNADGSLALDPIFDTKIDPKTKEMMIHAPTDPTGASRKVQIQINTCVCSHSHDGFNIKTCCNKLMLSHTRIF